jgi:hypothetical protein
MKIIKYFEIKHLPKPYRVLKPIKVSIKKYKGADYVASFNKAGVYSSGNTLKEVKFTFKDMLMGQFDALCQGEKILASHLLITLEVLRKHIEKD